jgi:diguanylate cyclase (GGDEF)-like protein
MLVSAGVMAGIASLIIVPVGDAPAAIVNAATVVVITALLVFGPRRRDPLASTRWFLVAALGTSFAASVMAVAYQAAAGHPPDRPWIGDVVALLYGPLTIIGLLRVPLAEHRPGFRTRALADGALAASSLWYLIAGLGLPRLSHAYPGAGGHATAICYAVGDVFVVATAATVLARCSAAVTRTIGGLVIGVTAIAAQDTWVMVSGISASRTGPVLLFQAALLVLVIACGLPSPRRTAHGRSPWILLSLSAAPFVPLLVDMTWTTKLILQGRGIPGPQVLPALLVAVALTARAWAASNEKQRLLEDLREREAGLESALRCDSLTGLANRLGLTERLASALADRRQWPVAVALLDLNDFKVINDSRGHAMGDELLRQTAQRLVSAVRRGDLVARLGGDEFAVVAPGLGPPDREPFAARLLDAFERPVEVGGQPFPMSSSIGIVFSDGRTTAGELLAHADAAMYQGKDNKQGRSSVHVFDDAGRASLARHLQIREAVADPDLEQFEVHLQPIIELQDAAPICGFEALLRWTHPALGAVPPGLFIPLAEQAGSIGKLGSYVLRTATAAMGELQREHPGRQLFISINVSPHQLTRAGFVEEVSACLRANELQPEQLNLEVTEQAFASHLSEVAGAVLGLAEVGVSIAIDDFGTGYSNFRYLQRLHPSAIKLDRGFIADLPNSLPTQRLVAAVVTMAAALDLRLIAEGIETAEQRDLLREMGCEFGQGYLFSRPVPVDEARRLLSAERRAELAA